MVCVVAIIVIAAQYNWEKSRLVFAVNDFSYPNYAVFQLPQNHQFPVPKDPHIVSTSTTVDRVGTHVQLYCSHRWRDYTIISRISDELNDITQSAADAFLSPIMEKNNCQNEIVRVQREKQKHIYFNKFFGYSTPRWSNFKNTSCKPKLIAELAFQGVLNVVGKYNNFVPPSRKPSLTIDINEPMELSDLVYQEQVYIGTDWKVNQRALAWYEGHLHIFKKTKRGSWLPFTDLGSERQNGDLIYKHMLENHPSFSQTHHNLVSHVSNLAGGHGRLEAKLRDPAFLDHVDSQATTIKHNVGQVKLEPLSPMGIWDTKSYISDQKPYSKSSRVEKIHNLNYVGQYAPHRRFP
ncbi:unnamed protein product [Blumeria hordei]|uniref:Uncharacterized protein n=2 Tax=Blumeria hordei TaxID=2867405 RepID=A0A383V2Y0_BLUHO|nr:secreted protein (signalp)/blumeria specific [Blumeria hordei DH14]SZF06155.1 unnamed protein product [Blumeria hordei]